MLDVQPGPQLPAAGVPESVHPRPPTPRGRKRPGPGVTHFPPPPPSAPRAPSSPTAQPRLPGPSKVGAWSRASPTWTPPRRTWPRPCTPGPFRFSEGGTPAEWRRGCARTDPHQVSGGAHLDDTHRSSNTRPLLACSEKVGLWGSNTPSSSPAHPRASPRWRGAVCPHGAAELQTRDPLTFCAPRV